MGNKNWFSSSLVMMQKHLPCLNDFRNEAFVRIIFLIRYGKYKGKQEQELGRGIDNGN